MKSLLQIASFLSRFSLKNPTSLKNPQMPCLSHNVGLIPRYHSHDVATLAPVPEILQNPYSLQRKKGTKKQGRAKSKIG